MSPWMGLQGIYLPMICFIDREGRKDVLMDFEAEPTKEVNFDMPEILRQLVLLAEYKKFSIKYENKFASMMLLPDSTIQEYVFNETELVVRRNPYSIVNRNEMPVTDLKEAAKVLEDLKIKAINDAKEEILAKLATARIESLLYGKD